MMDIILNVQVQMG